MIYIRGVCLAHIFLSQEIFFCFLFFSRSSFRLTCANAEHTYDCISEHASMTGLITPWNSGTLFALPMLLQQWDLIGGWRRAAESHELITSAIHTDVTYSIRHWSPSVVLISLIPAVLVWKTSKEDTGFLKPRVAIY